VCRFSFSLLWPALPNHPGAPIGEVSAAGGPDRGQVGPETETDLDRNSNGKQRTFRSLVKDGALLDQAEKLSRGFPQMTMMLLWSPDAPSPGRTFRRLLRRIGDGLGRDVACGSKQVSFRPYK
jgi:hypothetical protein